MAYVIKTEIVINHFHKRTADSNERTLKSEGYHLYPMNSELDVRKENANSSFGKGVVKKITWEDNSTIICYELIKLNGVN